MSFLERYKTDKTLEEEGSWVDFGDGIEVLIRRATGVHSRKTRDRLSKRFTAPYKNREVPESVMVDLVVEHLSQSIVVDWKGVTLEDGKPLPCNEENIRKVMKAFPDFRDDVAQASAEKATFQKIENEEMAKNSKSA